MLPLCTPWKERDYVVTAAVNIKSLEIFSISRNIAENYRGNEGSPSSLYINGRRAISISTDERID